MLDDIGPWKMTDDDFKELIRFNHDGTIHIDDLVMDAEELVRRIRATEALSAEDAMEVSKYTPGFKGVTVMRIYDALKDYARVLSDE